MRELAADVSRTKNASLAILAAAVWAAFRIVTRQPADWFAIMVSTLPVIVPDMPLWIWITSRVAAFGKEV